MMNRQGLVRQLGPVPSVLLLLAVFLLPASCSSGGDETGPGGSISLTINPTSASVAQGSSTTVTGTLTRSGGFTGDVSFTVEGAPAGVTGTVGNLQTSGTTTTAVITVQVGAAAPAGTYALTVRATGNGVDPATVVFQLTVTAAPDFSIAVNPASTSVMQGGTSPAIAITLTRTNFTGAVTLSLAGSVPAGVTAAFTPPAPTANNASMTVTVGAAVQAGSYSLQISGAGAPGTRSTPFTLTVTAAGSFTIGTTSGPVTMLQGQSNNVTTISITRTDFSAPILLTAENLPAGLTATFSPNPATTNSATLTLTAAANLVPNTYTVTVRGTAAAGHGNGPTLAALEATTTVSVTVNLWWNLSYPQQRQITVTAGAPGAPAGYSIPLVLNHATLVAAGKSLANGNDVRIAYWNGTAWSELDRVLDAGSTWNSSTTTIWFRSSASLQPNGSSSGLYLHYGNPGAGSPPATASNVFLFVDGFEAGNLNQWTQLPPALWAVDNTRAHTGTFSVRHPSEGDATRVLAANPALNLADVYLESWWYLSSSSTLFDVSQNVRHTGSPVNNTNSSYLTNLYEDRGLYGWFIGREINSEFFEVAPPAGTPVPNTWIRVGTGMQGTTLWSFINGAAINSASGLAQLTSGNVALQKWRVPAGNSWWVDDVIVRRYVNPEPTGSLGSEQTAAVSSPAAQR